MPEISFMDKDFLQKITDIIEENIHDERFGVSELAGEIGMSRSNLLRRVKKLSGLSVSRFIRNVRLKMAMEMMEEGNYTVSEVSYKVGFSSTSYFIKCFREHYGFPPGEVKAQEITDDIEIAEDISGRKKKRSIPVAGAYFLIVLFGIVLFVTLKPILFRQKGKEISIAVLPFKNDSNDSTNVYFINGLMESTLNNLQKIQDLRVISRTSVEKYRENIKTTPEIARELEVNYLVEGSGQKIGDKILLNIQLIDAQNDKQLWAEQYDRLAGDIFTLQSQIAKNIAEKIEVVISPEVHESIDKIPTNNLKAYDVFLKGIYLLNKGQPEKTKQSIPYLKSAIEMDGDFARAYAATAMAYYTLDENRGTQQYSDSINYFADKAMFLDPDLPQSLVAKACYYMITREYKLAVPYLEKALELNPNYDLVFVFLLDLYANHLPDTEKYLEYALRGLKIDISEYDSSIASFNYLHIANAFIQAGFVDEAEKYINKSLVFNPDNLYSAYTKAFILFARNKNLNQTKELLLEALSKDTTRLDIMQEVGKIYYYLRDYKSSYRYYKRFADIRNAYNLNIYNSENIKIGYVFIKEGNFEEGQKLIDEFREYAENDQSIYKHSSLAAYYSYRGETRKALEHLGLFSKEKNYFYWTVLFLPIEPLFDNINKLPEFKKTVNEIDIKFQKWHRQVAASLKAKGLI
jgi:TolB-like protein/AraC-like DNA-binding protein